MNIIGQTQPGFTIGQPIPDDYIPTTIGKYWRALCLVLTSRLNDIPETHAGVPADDDLVDGA